MFNPERINIKDLTIEEPEKLADLPFDPEKDIFAEDWEDMKSGFLKNMREAEHGVNRLHHLNRAIELKTLFPERSDELNLGPEIQKELEQLYDVESRAEYTSEALEKLKVLFPGKFKEIISKKGDPDWNEFKWEKMKEYLEEHRTGTSFSWHDIAGLAVTLKMIHPERISELNLNDEFVEKIKKSMSMDMEENDMYSFLSDASNFRILFPERVGELNLDNKFWTKAKKEFRSLIRDKKYHHPSTFAMNMKILAAEDLKFTDRGMEVVMPEQKESLQEDASSIPEVRNF